MDAEIAMGIQSRPEGLYISATLPLTYLEDQDQLEDVDDQQSELAREAGPDPDLMANESCCSWNWAKHDPHKEAAALQKNALWYGDWIKIGHLFVQWLDHIYS